MAINPDDLNIVQNTDKKRFEVEIDGELAMVEYIAAGKNIIFTHTEVPVAFEGMGVGGALANHVLEYARDNELKVQPLCPFIKSYLMRHKDDYEGMIQW